MEKCYNTDVLKNKVAEWDSVPEKHSAQAKRGSRFLGGVPTGAGLKSEVIS